MADDYTIEEQSILVSTKHKLGTVAQYDHFDHDILVEINAALTVLFQVGAGGKSFRINSGDETWDDLKEAVGYKNDEIVELVKDYVYLSTKLIFDPPESSAHIEALRNRKDELEWRIFYFEDEWPT